MLTRNGMQNTRYMRCDLCPYEPTPSPNQDVMDDCRPPLQGPSLQGPNLLDMTPPCVDATAPQWILPWTAIQSFQDDPSGLGRVRKLEEGFPNVGFNSYGLNQSRHGMPGPGRFGDEFMWPSANGSPSDSGNLSGWMWPPAATQRRPDRGVNALPSASASVSVGGEAAIDVVG